MSKLDTHCIVRLPSGEQRLISMNCSAVIGAVSNPQSKNRVIGKAGYNRLRGIRPTVGLRCEGACGLGCAVESCDAVELCDVVVSAVVGFIHDAVCVRW